MDMRFSQSTTNNPAVLMMTWVAGKSAVGCSGFEHAEVNGYRWHSFPLNAPRR